MIGGHVRGGEGVIGPHGVTLEIADILAIADRGRRRRDRSHDRDSRDRRSDSRERNRSLTPRKRSSTPRKSVSIPRQSESRPPPQPVKEILKQDEPTPMIKEEPVRIAMKKTVFSLKKPSEKKKVVPRAFGFKDDSDDEGGLGVKADELVKEEPTPKAAPKPMPKEKSLSPMKSPVIKALTDIREPAPAPATPPKAVTPAPAPTEPAPAPATTPPAQATNAQEYQKQLEEYYKKHGYAYPANAAAYNANQYAAYPGPTPAAQSAAAISAEEQLKAYAASGIPIGLQYPVSRVTVEVGTDLKSLGLIPQLQSTGGPCSYSVHPTLPPGMKINPTTGELYGMPTEVSGTIAVNVYASNNWGTAVTSIMFTVVEPPENDMDGANDLDLGLRKSKKVYRTKSEAIDDFEAMLAELKCSLKETWHEAQIRLKKDERFYALHMMSERRRVWQRYINDVDSAAPSQPAVASNLNIQNPMFQAQTYPPTNPEEAFLQLLKERLSSRKEVFDDNPLQFIVNDPRFNGVAPEERQQLVQKHLNKKEKVPTAWPLV
eukprot:TRINITY_DN1009_c0_g1_i1.p1 TRINITY_DN1009_c0_g1~~TRINITY_DN1009_c0_g1_i1.p1  ORF type:complete len:545 (+),score=123.71 TRINITY_DN1009_c0_g1_i1:61-1695(+)